MKTVFKFSVFAIFLLSGMMLNAQCSIQTYESNGQTVKEAKAEKVYKNIGKDNNGDATYGFFLVYGRLYSVGNESWGLQIITSASGYYARLIPRQITIWFEDNTSLSLQSSTLKVDGKMDICNYELSSIQIALFSKGIRSIILEDNRTIQYKTIVVQYKFILSEQYNCIKKTN